MKPLFRKTRGVDAVYTEQVRLLANRQRGWSERYQSFFFARGSLTRSFVGVITGI